MMNKYLAAAVERYTIGETKIYPISGVDAKIIDSMIQLFWKMQFTDAVAILQEYKFLKDDDILESLEALNAKIGKAKPQDVTENPGGSPLFVRYLKSQGQRIDMYLVIGYNAVELADRESGDTRYCIQLNPTPDNAKNIPYYANALLVYNTEEERERVVDMLDKWLEVYRGAFLKEEDNHHD